MKYFLLISILLLGCHEYPSVVRVCANHGKQNQYCGTGFFIDKDKLVTSTHIIEASNNGKITAIGPGPNESSCRYESIGELTSTVKFNDDIANRALDICEDVRVGVPVILKGFPRGTHSAQIRHGILDRIQDGNILVIIMNSEIGFSGGPIIDKNQGCVIGATYGTYENYTVAERISYENI